MDEGQLILLVHSVGTLLGSCKSRKIVDGCVTADACEVLDAHCTNTRDPALELVSAVVAGYRRAASAVRDTAEAKPSDFISCIGGYNLHRLVRASGLRDALCGQAGFVLHYKGLVRHSNRLHDGNPAKRRDQTT